jgi:competence protein ComEC
MEAAGASESVSEEMEVDEIHENAFGYDHWNTNEEYIVFENNGDDPLDLSGWTVENEEGHTYAFPEGYTLEPHSKVSLHTGTGDDSATDLYWGSDRAIWKNEGDTVLVKNDRDAVVLKESYS